jgi:hypothetical protein
LTNITTLFKVCNARSKAYDDHETGDVAFVSNGFSNNGIVGFVKPLKGDRVFDFEAICISAFCEATVQFPPFIARGNGGSKLTVLEPINKMSYEEMLFHAATISQQSWKFSFGRMISRNRLRNLQLNGYDKPVHYDFSKLLPDYEKKDLEEIGKICFEQFRIDALFNLERGDFHSLKVLKKGKYPTVSRTTEDNGVVGYSAIPKKAIIHRPLTITVSTTTGDAFVQLEEYLATDNVVICTSKSPMSLGTLFFVALMLNREKWRYSYGRQCYKEKFAKTTITLPVDEQANINQNLIDKIVGARGYWPIVTKIASNLTVSSQPTLNTFVNYSSARKQ